MIFPFFMITFINSNKAAAVGNFVQRKPPNLASQMRPPGFNLQNNQGNQNRYQGNNFNSNQNRGGNFNQNRQNNQGAVYQAPPYQPPTNQPLVNQALPLVSQIQGVSKMDFDNYVKANDAVLKNVQNQGQNLQNQMANVTSLLTSLCHNFKNSAFTSNSGTLPSQTVTNPREQINAITTRSGKILEGPSIPTTLVVSTPQKEPEQNPETSMDKVQKPSSESTAQVPPSEEEDSIFIEISKPKAKKTVNVEIQDLNSPRPNSLRVPIILGRILSFVTTKAPLIDLYEGKLTFKRRKGKTYDPFSGSTDDSFPSSSPIKTSDSTSEEFTDEFALPNSLPPGDDVSILKKNLQEDTFRIISNPLFKFDDNFKSSNVNPLFEEKDKDVEIKSSSSSTLTSPEASELEDYLEKDSIPPGNDLTPPTSLEVSSSNPTSPTLTGEKVCLWKTPMFFSLVRFVWKMMNRIAIRKKIICLLAAFLHKKPKTLSRPQEIEEIKEQVEEVSSDVQINTIVMPIRITFDNPIDFNDHFSKPKDLKKDLTICVFFGTFGHINM
ncbi:hypothetical protein Tco_0180773 [Tanacetum coccineum]